MDINNNNSVINDFMVVGNEFTVFVIGQTYFYNRGHNYLNQFIYKENWIASDRIIEKRIKRLISWIQKKTPNIAELVQKIMTMSESTSSKLNLIDIIVSLSKLFCATEHVAAGPKVVDPVIIEEEKVTKKNLTQYVTMHENCKYRPTIIVLLKDDNFERVEKLFSNCPNGMNIKMIYNNGSSIYYKVINKGAKNVMEFLDSYARQCFSTCSKTEHGILTSEEWSNNPVISKFSPTIFQIRSTFIKEHKLDAIQNIQWLNDQLELYTTNNSNDEYMKKSFICMSKLFEVYCYDKGGDNLNQALNLAKDLENEILKAHVYRYSHFFNCNRNEKQDLLQQAENIFTKNNIADHAVYCRNNRLIHQFSMEKISINDFCELKGKATYDTPGLILMAHIINNVGVAYLFEHFIDKSIEEFHDGLNFSHNNHIQNLAIRSNLLIAETLNYSEYNEKEAKSILSTIFGTPSLGINKMPFLTAQFALNVVASALMADKKFALHLLHEYKIVDLVQSSFNTNIMGTGSMIKQLKILSEKHNEFKLLQQLKLPKNRTPISGIRYDFICRYGLNPFFFNTWL